MQARPVAIIVGSHAGLSSCFVAQKLRALTTETTERWNNRFIQCQDKDDNEYHSWLSEFCQLYPNHEENDEDDVEWKCNVEMVDDNIAQLFGINARGRKKFPDVAVNQKCAISIARCGKDPLAKIVYTWSIVSDAGVFGTEMLFLNVHSLLQLWKQALLLGNSKLLIFLHFIESQDIKADKNHTHQHNILVQCHQQDMYQTAIHNICSWFSYLRRFFSGAYWYINSLGLWIEAKNPQSMSKILRQLQCLIQSCISVQYLAWSMLGPPWWAHWIFHWSCVSRDITMVLIMDKATASIDNNTDTQL